MREVESLSVTDRMALMEYLARSVQKELELKPRRKKGSSLNRVVGALREKGKPAPTDTEVQDMLSDYLMKKHCGMSKIMKNRLARQTDGMVFYARRRLDCRKAPVDESIG